MPYEILYFRDADKVIKSKKMVKDVKTTLDYLNDSLDGAKYKMELLRQALQDTQWRENGSLKIFDNRRYCFKGIKQRIAIEGSFSIYEYILEGLLRLQIGFKQKKIDAGILLLPAKRGEKSPYGTTAQLVKEDVQLLEALITVPVVVVLYDLAESTETAE